MNDKDRLVELIRSAFIEELKKNKIRCFPVVDGAIADHLIANGATFKKHGEWFLLDECSNEGVYCSVCHKKVYDTHYARQKVKSRFCPNCGAEMDGQRKENCDE